MAKKCIFLAAAVFLTACFGLAVLFAQEKQEDYKARINELRKEMAQVKYDYQEAAQKVNRTSEDKIEAARQEFHKARTVSLEDRKQKVDALTRAYKDKTRPMEAEEKSILEALAPSQGMNFAKPKAEKDKAK